MKSQLFLGFPSRFYQEFYFSPFAKTLITILIPYLRHLATHHEKNNLNTNDDALVLGNTGTR